MKTVIEMAREVYGVHTEWTGAPLDRLTHFAELVRADEREQGQRWFDAVTAQHKQEILAEREACAKVCACLVMGKDPDDIHSDSQWVAFTLAAAIRARSNT